MSQVPVYLRSDSTAYTSKLHRRHLVNGIFHIFCQQFFFENGTCWWTIEFIGTHTQDPSLFSLYILPLATSCFNPLDSFATVAISIDGRNVIISSLALIIRVKPLHTKIDSHNHHPRPLLPSQPCFIDASRWWGKIVDNHTRQLAWNKFPLKVLQTWEYLDGFSFSAVKEQV